MRCKVFNTTKGKLEEEVNKWLESEKIEIYDIHQTVDVNMGYVTLTIFYYTKLEVRLKKLDKLNNLNK